MPQATSPFENLVLRLPDVMAMVAMSRSSIYRAMAEGDFPKAIPLSGRAVGWRRAEIERWVAERPSSTAPCANNEQYQSKAYLTSRASGERKAAGDAS